MKRLVLLGLGVLAALVLSLPARDAAAYPQYQLAKGETCVSCHVSPSGGGLLSEYGRDTAEENATKDHDPGLFYGKLDTPDWLELGGDFRAAAGTETTPNFWVTGFPMQMDLYAVAKAGSFSVHVTGGFKPGETAIDYLQAREHYVQWKAKPDETEGLYVRAGRMMPVLGLRLAEHPAYTRRYGGTPLFGEVYGVQADYIKSGWELHAMGFMHDPLQYSYEQGDGAAAYVEKRLGEDHETSIGLETKFAHTDREYRVHGGLTYKHWCGCHNLLFMAEVQGVQQHFDDGGYRRNSIVGYGMASWQPKNGWMVDLGLGHYDEDLDVKDLDRDAADLNIHWFYDSHLELALTSRVEMIGFGNGGRTGTFSLLQAHFRL